MQPTALAGEEHGVGHIVDHPPSEALLDDPELSEDALSEERPSRRPSSLLIAIAMLVAVDLVIGLIAGAKSAEQLEADEIRATAAEIGAADGRTMVFLGSNAVDTDVEPDRISAGLGGEAWEVGMASADASSIAVWAAAYDQHFSRAGRVPDALVIGFVNDELEDRNRVDWAAIGQLHTGWGSLPDRVRETPDSAAGLDVFGSRLSSLVGNRRWLFDVVSAGIPGHSSVPRAEPAAPIEVRTFDRLAALVARAHADGAQVMVVALPTQRSYPIQDGMMAEIDAAGGTLIDLRLEGRFSDEQFTSSASLTPEAALDFSERLATELRDEVN